MVGVNTVEPVKANNEVPNLAVLAQVAETLDPLKDQVTEDLIDESASDAKSVQIQEVDSEPIIALNQNPQSASLSRRQTTTPDSVPATTSAPSTPTPTPVPTPTPTPAPVPVEPSSNNKSTAIINTAKQYIGVKYVWGGTSPSGFDCSGFVQYVFAKNGVTLPRVSRDQYNIGSKVDFNNLQPGDLVFFTLNGDTVVNHLGIYIGDGQFIHASSSKGVVISSFSSYWTSSYSGAKRVL
ncbi:MAG: hypothetical protein APF84_19380 [Gracilibacter sp. BRH_c7a]|nr:MAG: hypothetical protein APF84_19380 [Gracilibacter sp. BRH_c7a]